MVSATSRGAGTDGLPMDRSNTLSAPTCALRASPKANVSRILFGAAPSARISSFIIEKHFLSSRAVFAP